MCSVQRATRMVGLVSALGSLALLGCGSPAEYAALGVGVATVVGAQSPSHEIEQVYYLGVFDPREQVPPSIYRITVHGQASFLSLMRFGSGWVPAELADSLNSDLSSRDDGTLPGRHISGSDSDPLQTGRRLILFGSEGFREAPRNHRLVIVMGASPENYFSAVDQVLGTIDPSGRSVGNLRKQLLDELVRTQQEQEQLERLQKHSVSAQPQ